jgi:Taurine catabolism dioxygenase TauD, TfdA family
MPQSSSAINSSHAIDASPDIRPITPAISAEIHGVRLSGDLPAETLTAIRDALLRHRVVFFRGQGHLDEAEHQAFARLLGPIVPHPTVPSVAATEAVLDIDAETARASRWHTDVTFVPAFPQFSVLRGVVTPPVGGDTVWANTVAAYDTLPPVLRSLADQLWALHSNAYDYGAAYPNATTRQAQRYQTVFRSTVYETEHPVGAGASADRRTGDHPRPFGPQAPRRQSGGLRPSVCHAAGSRDAAGKHGALALVGGRCGDLGQSCDAAQGHR